MNILLYKYVYFYYKVYKYSFKLLREKRQILRNRLSNARLRLEMKIVKAGLKKCIALFEKKMCVLFLSGQYRIHDEH